MASKVSKTRRRESLLSTVWGGMWGVVVGGVIVTVASQLAVRHDLVLPKPEARAVETPAGTEFDQARPETDPNLPSEETVPAADVAAVTPAQPGPADASPQFDTTPASAPRTGFDGPAAPDRPNVPTGANVALTSREGLRPETGAAPEAMAPLPPGVERNVAVARDAPAAPARDQAEAAAQAAPQTVAPTPPASAPIVADDDTAPATETAPPRVVTEATPVQPDAEPDRVPLADAASPEAPDLAALEPQVPVAPSVETPVAPDVSERAPELALETPAPAAPVADAPEEAPAQVATPAVPEVPSQEEATLELAEVQQAPELRLPAAPAQPDAGADVPQMPRALADAPTLIQTSEPRRIAPGQGAGGTVSIGTPAARLGITEDATVADVTPSSEMPSSSVGALGANRTAFDADPNLSKLAVVLTHQGDELPDADALSDLPSEVSFAVDARAANAGAIAAAYRAADREVVLIPSFPPRATPQDIEVALGSNLGNVAGAVAVMDPGSAGFQNDRAAVGQVIAVLAESGHGLITASRGLNTAKQIADRFDVPAALIFNELPPSADAGTATRALDRIAFRARQETGIIVLAPGDSVTVTGLVDWLAGRSSSGLQIAPVSAVLDPQGSEETDASDGSEGSDGLPQVRRLPQIQTQSN